MEVTMICGWQVKFFETVESTMDVARSYLDDKIVIWASCQKSGRGRFGKTWMSKSGNLFCSLIIKPEIELRRWGELAFLTALTVGYTIETFLESKKVQFKWPNDILLEGQKISGILLEIQDPFIVIGIGVNIANSPLINNYRTTCLKDYVEDLPQLIEIITHLIENFQKKLEHWYTYGFKFLRNEWLQQAAFLDSPILLKTKENETLASQGFFKGIDDNGSLLLKLANGSLKKYHTGEIFLF